MNELNTTDNSRPLLVTMALPYANGDIHLGHLVEAVQTDIFVRAQKMTGRETRFICADDTHGTPIEISAMNRGITPEELIAEAWSNHTRDYASYGIGFDIYSTTNSDENREWAEKIYLSLKEEGLIKEQNIHQFYCEHDKRFLPDRFIKGTCPKCGATDQYGDNCEVCGASYDAEELKSAACSLCGNTPVLKESTHFFMDVEPQKEFLKEYLSSSDVIQSDMKSFIFNWIEDLQPRCISRDAPYFGFLIPGTENKFFYVWLDAPVGYVSSTEIWAKDKNRELLDFWGKDSDCEVVHVIGKDIVYFHTILWPVMLQSVGLKLPSKFMIHGFLTVEGEKMSKSRGTFILAKDYIDRVEHPDAGQFLRYYYATKLSGGNNDLDFNIDEFINRINSTIVNNIGNFQNRTSTLLDRFFNSTIPDSDWDEDIANEAQEHAAVVKNALISGNYRVATDAIHSLGSIANRYFQDKKPWELLKLEDKSEAEKVLTTCANLVRSLATLLKPIIPEIAERVEKQFRESFSWETATFSLRGYTINSAEKLALPLEREMFDKLYSESPQTAVAQTEPEPEEEEINFPDFTKVAMRVGEIISAENMKKSKKMMKIQLFDGWRNRQIMSGIAQHYKPEDLVGKKVVFVSNLKPAKLMGEISEGMILAAENSSGELTLVTVDPSFQAGSSVS